MSSNNRNNVRSRAISFSAAFVFAFSAIAAPENVVEWRDSSAIRLKFDVAAGGEVRSDYRIVATPVVKGDDGNALVLPSVEFAGKRNRKYAERAAVLRGESRPATYAPDAVVHVDTVIAAEPWMRATRLTLEVERFRAGCCDVEEMAASELAESRYVAPVPPFVPEPELVMPRVSEAERIAKDESVLRPIEEYEPYNPDVALRKMKDALFVHFHVNKSELRRDYMQNAATLDKIVDIMRRIKADSTSRVARVTIVGLASPDGPVVFNNNLSRRRAEALRDYVDSRVSLPDSIYEVVAGGEAWADLRDVVAESDLPQRDRLLEIIDETEDVNHREVLLRRLDGGRPWRELRNMFVEQRNSGYIRVWYEAVPDTAATIINESIELIEKGDIDAAIDKLEPLADDRKWNALGSAYYRAGRKADAIRSYERGAAAGDEAARRNLNELKAN